jgi:hypothetical protein
MKRAVGRAIVETMFLFGLLVWGYTVLIQITHPDWVTEAFSHVDVFPFNWRLDEVGMTAFAVAAIGFFLSRLQIALKRK